MKRALLVIGWIFLGLLALLSLLFGSYMVTASAIPLQRTYVIKQTIESGIERLSLINPTWHGYFSVIKLNRRYDEVNNTILKNQDASGAVNAFLNQVNATFFDIQSVPDAHTRLTLTGQHQQFVANAAGNLNFLSDQLQEQLEKEPTIKSGIFVIDHFVMDNGKLKAVPQNISLKEYTDKKTASDKIVSSNIALIQQAVETLNHFKK